MRDKCFDFTCAVNVLATDDVRHAFEIVLWKPNVLVPFHGDRVFAPVKHEVLRRISVYLSTHTHTHVSKYVMGRTETNTPPSFYYVITGVGR